MNNLVATTRLLVLTAARNVLNHRMKSVIVGFILMFGTALLVLGTSLLDSVERSMQKTVTQSLAGHIQVYSSDAADKLALFGAAVFGGDDIGQIDDFGAVRQPIEQLDNVEAVVPMGMVRGRFVMGNRLDEILGRIRRAVDRRDWAEVGSLGVQVRAMARDLKTENRARAQIAADPGVYRDNIDRLERVIDPDFWSTELPDAPRQTLLFLDTKIAPLAADGNIVFMRLLGTDPRRFAEHFDRFEIVAGQHIPPGKHGLLISQRAYDGPLKNDVARHLDDLRDDLHDDERVIAEDGVLQSDIDRLQSQYRRVVFGLAPAQVEAIKTRLRDFLAIESDDIKTLLRSFLALTDANFDARYSFFYDQIAPLMRLHDFDVGDQITVQAFSGRGFPRSANLRFYGTFQFEGLEDSDLAQSVDIVDLPTFRRLYGAMSDADRAELAQIRQDAGVQDIHRDDAEDALFGGGGRLVVEQPPDNAAVKANDSANDSPSRPGDDSANASAEPKQPAAADQPGLERANDGADTYRPDQLDHGLARSGAVILDDPTKLAQTKAAVEAVIDAQDLGLNVLDWQEASGIVGQFVIVIRLALFITIGIIFLVALVIINNSMVMATVERTNEIGTMRAIGAQRGYVMALFLMETLILAVAAGLLGTALGAAAVAVAGHIGIPATTDFLRFLFAGDRLYPALSAGNVAWAFGSILAVSLISTLYPARLATRIQPIVAMRK